MQVHELEERVERLGRDHAIPLLSAEKLRALEREEARAAAIEEQERERAALERVEMAGKDSRWAAENGCCEGPTAATDSDPTGADTTATMSGASPATAAGTPAPDGRTIQQQHHAGSLAQSTALAAVCVTAD